MYLLAVILYLGGWFIFPIYFYFNFDLQFSYLFLFCSWWLFALKVILVLFCFLWVRAAFPRYRYDQLMLLGWEVILPLSLGFIPFYSGLLFCFSALPHLL
jgi:NADH-quinone oxidoreductase subunit H